MSRAQAIPLLRRHHLIHLTIERLSDKNSNVRKRAIQLLSEFIKTHPFELDGGELNSSFFKQKLVDIEKELSQLAPNDILESIGIGQVENINPSISSQLDDRFNQAIQNEDTQDEIFIPSTLDTNISNLLLKKKYYLDGIRFVHQIETTVPNLCQLLVSKSKIEVIEAIEFLVIIYLYKIEPAKDAIKKMIHLIWEKDETVQDEDKKISVKDSVVNAFKRIYLESDPSLSLLENDNQKAYNLIQLFTDLTVAELVSLEELLNIFTIKSMIPLSLLELLWKKFHDRTEDKVTQRASIALLSMLANYNPKTIEDHLDILLNHGIKTAGTKDLLIAKYSLIALRKLTGKPSEKKDIKILRISSNHYLFDIIGQLVISFCCHEPW